MSLIHEIRQAIIRALTAHSVPKDTAQREAERQLDCIRRSIGGDRHWVPGPRKQCIDDAVAADRAAGKTPADIAKRRGVSRRTVYRSLARSDWELRR